MVNDDAIRNLAKRIDQARNSEPSLISAEEIGALRRRGACQLHQICADFAASLKSKLSAAALDLSPATYAEDMFRAPGQNLIQISSQGRELQITFKATPQLFSTDSFLIPYTLDGEIRAYNQQMLERFEIRSHLLFYCLEGNSATWRTLDWRSGRTGPVNSELLASLIGKLF